MSNRESKLFVFSDLITAVTFALCLPFAWTLSIPRLKVFCDVLGRIHIRLRGGKTDGLDGHAALACLKLDARRLERDVMATVYEETCYTLREHRKRGWQPRIRLHGRKHIEQALESGRGVVLWINPSSYAELIVKKALHEADIPLVNLRSYVHPYSGSRWGKRFLNWIRTSVEDRYLQATVVLYPDREAVALRELQLWLRKNAVVSISAIAAGGHPFAARCLSGTLKLAMGAPTLARLSRSPLLPVYTCGDESGGFDVTVEKPLQDAVHGKTATPEAQMAKAFAELTATEIAKCPKGWRGWLSRSLWQPD